MVGKVIHDGEKYVVKNEYSDLPLKPDGPNKTKLIEMVEKQGFVFVDFEVDTIAEGTSDFDVIDTDVAVILKVYNERIYFYCNGKTRKKQIPNRWICSWSLLA
jgi:hypothetical protein